MQEHNEITLTGTIVSHGVRNGLDEYEIEVASSGGIVLIVLTQYSAYSLELIDHLVYSHGIGLKVRVNACIGNDGDIEVITMEPFIFKEDL